MAAIKEQESGKKVADICRALGVHQATFYNWKKKYAGMDNQELRRFTELEGGKPQDKKAVMEDMKPIYKANNE